VIEPISGTLIAGKVVEFLVTTFAGKEIDRWFSSRDKRKAFRKRMAARNYR